MPPLSTRSYDPADLPASPRLPDVEAAARRLAGVAVRTPLLESAALNQALGLRVLVKAEVLQRTGSFKFRGAYNRISQLGAAERRGGVVAFSSGNHAQGVAHAAALCGMPAVIIMPHDAPAVKREGTRSYGAEVVLYDRFTEDREAIGRRIAEERGATLVPPYDDPSVIAGQGTVGLEIIAQCTEAGFRPDQIIVPAGGGGLIAGTSLAVTARWPDVPVQVAEPAGFDDHRRSLLAGDRRSNAPTARSMCDALLAPMPGVLTFAINRHTVSGGIAVSDEEVAAAMRAAFRHLKVVIEPGGAVALAAVLAGHAGTAGQTLVVVASGGNVDPELFCTIVAGRGGA